MGSSGFFRRAVRAYRSRLGTSVVSSFSRVDGPGVAVGGGGGVDVSVGGGVAGGGVGVAVGGGGSVGRRVSVGDGGIGRVADGIGVGGRGVGEYVGRGVTPGGMGDGSGVGDAIRASSRPFQSRKLVAPVTVRHRQIVKTVRSRTRARTGLFI